MFDLILGHIMFLFRPRTTSTQYCTLMMCSLKPNSNIHDFFSTVHGTKQCRALQMDSIRKLNLLVVTEKSIMSTALIDTSQARVVQKHFILYLSTIPKAV